MAIKNMVRIRTDYTETIKNEAWEYSEELSAPANGDTVIIPEDVQNISVTLVVTAGSGKIQATTDLLATVESGTGVTWVDWDHGVVTATTQDVAKPVTALRQVNVSGTTKLVMRAQ